MGESRERRPNFMQELRTCSDNKKLDLEMSLSGRWGVLSLDHMNSFMEIRNTISEHNRVCFRYVYYNLSG